MPFSKIEKLLLLLICMMSVSMHGQDLKQHQWKKRLIVIVASEENNAYLKEQLATLSTDSKGCADRNLLIYHVLPKKYGSKRASKNSEVDWKNGEALYQKYNLENKAFTVHLIGLDGSIKMTGYKPWTLQTIFDTIDSMPMRMSENGK